jgi:hypothetical protein
LKQNKSPIEVIEDDAFISFAFVDQIYLDGIKAKRLKTNAFRGLSFCKNLYLTNTQIEEIEASAFFRANNIKRLSLMNSRIKLLHKEAFRGVFNIETLDLRGNYLTRINESTFEPLIVSNQAESQQDEQQSRFITNESIMLIDNERKNNFIVKSILFEQNPIQCDCSLIWVLRNRNYLRSISLPELCAGPRGYDCLRISDLDEGQIICPANFSATTTMTSNSGNLPCDHIVFDAETNLDMYVISIPKGRTKSNSSDLEDEETIDEEDGSPPPLESNEYETADQSGSKLLSDLNENSQQKQKSFKTSTSLYSPRVISKQTSTAKAGVLAESFYDKASNVSSSLSNSAHCFRFCFRFFNFFLPQIVAFVVFAL